MRIESNRWNRLRYTAWSPLYDLVGRRFDPFRRRSIALLSPSPGDRLLLVGAGTGADLPYLPPDVHALATDITPAMLARARPRQRPGVHLAVMDGHALAVPDRAFDGALLHLILAVIPDPARCLADVARALRPGGRVAVFDKFVAAGTRPSAPRRLANVVTRALFTDINRRFEEILAASGAPLVVECDEPALGGLFRHIVLAKTGETGPTGTIQGSMPGRRTRP
jgi:phosphatidylethanolamine/phosphatidyl-N-methylethanolamine N-methyltransferase